MLKQLVGVTAIAVGLVAVPSAENWPQWRGPSLNGISAGTNLPVSWSTTQNVTWKFALPAWSGSTPIVWGDRIFLNVAEGRDLYLWCVDRTRGALIWKQLLGGGNTQRQKQNMSSPSPVTDGRNVWVMTVAGGDVVTGHDPSTGKELWRAEGLNPSHDNAHRIVASPFVFGDMIFVPSRERPLLALKAGGDVSRPNLLWSFNNGPDVPTPAT